MISIAFPFRLAPGGKIGSTATYAEIVRGQVIDALMTNQGERVFRPRYGCDVQAALFDPSNELVRKDAASMLRTRLEQFVPRAMVRSCTIDVASEPGVVYITVVYRPSLYSTDTVVTVPVSSEFINRQNLALDGGFS